MITALAIQFVSFVGAFRNLLSDKFEFKFALLVILEVGVMRKARQASKTIVRLAKIKL
jgi:hypothetical protein